MRVFPTTFVLTLFCLVACSTDRASDGYDIVIVNGRVMDPETKFDQIANVGIVGDRIVTITTAGISGGRTVDATGHAVVPGFINTHSHSFGGFDQKMMARDGTTTILDTELGSAAIDVFYDRHAGNSLLNYGMGIGHEPIRQVVMDGLDRELAADPTYALNTRGAAQEDGHSSWAVDVPTPEQRLQILRMFEQGILDGAVAVASTVGYMSYGTPTAEMFDLQKLAKKYDRLFGAHTRFGPTDPLPLDYSLGTREVIANAVALDGALILSHIINQGWDEIYELTRRLQEKGMVIFSEYYPAITGNPNISTPQLLPGRPELETIEITKDVFSTTTGKPYESEEAFFKEQQENPAKPIFITLRPEEWLEQWPYMKDIAIANDVVAVLVDGEPMPIETDYSEYTGHPRNAGTYGIVFRQAREKGIPLMEMVNNASYVPAKYWSMLGLEAMQERGRMQEGMIADITVFDPEQIAETSAMMTGQNGSPTEGIPYVLVAGQFVVDQGVAKLDTRPGRPIRYPVIQDEPDLDLGDEAFQWWAGYPDVRPEGR